MERIIVKIHAIAKDEDENTRQHIFALMDNALSFVL